MKKISLLDLSSSIHGGENFAFTKELNVFGYHLPYLTAKSLKKATEKFFDTGLMVTGVASVGAACYGIIDTDKSKTGTLSAACAFVGGAVVMALLKGAAEDFIIDPAYKALDLDLG